MVYSEVSWVLEKLKTEPYHPSAVNETPADPGIIDVTKREMAPEMQIISSFDSFFMRVEGTLFY